MKRLLALLCATALYVAILLGGCTRQAPNGAQVVTSFYPLYIFTLNLTDGIDEIHVENMAQAQGGCLHDYQLLPRDMRLLSGAELLILNGAGLEPFAGQLAQQMPNLNICDSSVGASLLQEGGEAHEHNAGGTHDHVDNAHIWLSIANAKSQVQTICNALCAAFPAAAEKLQSNCAAYLERLDKLERDVRQTLAPAQEERIVTFHEGIAYFAHAFGLKIIHEVETHEGAQPGARELAGLVRQLRTEGIRTLVIDRDAPPVSADVLARETGAPICRFNTITNGVASLTAYEEAMRQNAQALLEAMTA